MRGYVTDWRGREWLLPYPTQWELEYTAGVPCDSFTFRCPWEMGGETAPGDWVRFSARYQGKDMFNGVVDECQVTLDQGGCQLEISGRGLAALLLDNEAIGQDYGTATLADILRDHVTPYGIQTAPGAALPAVTRFSVATGSSEWSVVYDFARYYGGVCPRFDRLGRLTAVDAIHRAVIVAPIFQLGLDGPHLLTAGALPVGRRLGLLGQGDHRNIHHKQKGQRPRQPPLLRHAFASIPGNSVRRQTGGYERQFFPAAGIGILKSGHTGRKQERMCPGW